MKHTVLWAALAASFLGSPAFAQSSSSANQTSNSSSTASNAGANSSTNTSTSSATQNATSGSTAANTNSQSNGLNATINIVNPVPSSPADGTLRQNISGETTQNQKLDATTRSESFSSGEHHQYIDYSGSYTIKNVPNVQAPPLISSNDTCMGSASGGLSVAGFGVSGGSTYTDEHCKRIKMSRELWNKGMKAASLALDCMDRDAREALELTGFVCPQTVRAQRAAAEATQARMGPAAVPVVTLVPRPAEEVAPLPAPVVADTPAPIVAGSPAPVAAEALAPVPAAPLPTAPAERPPLAYEPAPEALSTPIAAASPEPSTLVRRVDDGAMLPVRR